MAAKFDILIDYADRRAWEGAGWSRIAGKFAVASNFTSPPTLFEIAYPVESDAHYSRLRGIEDDALAKMGAVGAPIPPEAPELVCVYAPFPALGGAQWLGAFSKAFGGRLPLMLVNSWFAEHAGDDAMLGIIMHELLHAGLRHAGDETPKDASGHSVEWWKWAHVLEDAYHTGMLFDAEAPALACAQCSPPAR